MGYYLAVTIGGYYWLTIGNLSANSNVTALTNIGYGGYSYYYMFLRPAPPKSDVLDYYLTVTIGDYYWLTIGY
ncbi:MAG: hypothetical protein V4538_00210 [Bacteroidota bacterium]